MQEAWQEVRIPVGPELLEGDLVLPEGATGLVLFAHGSGSSRHSPRNRFVAAKLRGEGVGTLLIDLLTRQEERIDQVTGEFRFDIDFLARRLMAITDWAVQAGRTRSLRLGYYGSSTGAAAALRAAAERSNVVGAVVSRGGRPDLAARELTEVCAPTLLIVGGNDDAVLALNREAYQVLRSEKQLVIVPGAGHLFEEPGALEQVARHAAGWFGRWLGAGASWPVAPMP